MYRGIENITKSARDPNVDPTDRQQIWEAPVPLPTFNPPKLSPAGGDQGDTSGGWQTN